MCGILISYSPTNQHPPPNFPDMLGKISHRGLDQHTIHDYPTVKVGFCRLAITDRETPQPGTSHGWTCFLVGEIYNYKELGFLGTECEVLAQGFARYGTNFVKRLNGMFTIVAIHSGNVFVFRDRYGQKPMYYFETSTGLILSSEIKPILGHPEYKARMNESARLQWVTFHNILTDETLFQGIYKMEKGTCWHLNSDWRWTYWGWNFAPEPMPYNEAKAEVRRLVEQAVNRMIPDGIAFGSLLSGGIDSGIIVGLLPDCPTFTAGYSEGNDERALAEISSRGNNYQILFKDVTNLKETISSLEDLRVGASWSNYALFQLAAKYCTVIFDGSGSDELFLGYKWRYEKPDYWEIVNRTGMENEHCRRIFQQAFPVDTLEERLKFDAEHFLEGVNIVTDRMSSAHTIECRQPFLDNDLVDFALTIPHEYKQGKQILKDAFADILPVEVLNAKKQGWSSPDWIKAPGNNQAERWANKSLEIWEETFIFAQ